MHWVFVAACGLSLFAMSRGCCLVAAHGFLISEACFVAEGTGSLAPWLQQLRFPGSAVAAHEVSCPEACGIFPDQGSNLYPLRWQVILNHCTTGEVLPRGFLRFGKVSPKAFPGCPALLPMHLSGCGYQPTLSSPS